MDLSGLFQIWIGGGIFFNKANETLVEIFSGSKAELIWSAPVYAVRAKK